MVDGGGWERVIEAVKGCKILDIIYIYIQI
jgi:hypothetical protein